MIMLPFFCLLHYLGWLRSEPADEVEGLDSRYHLSSKVRDSFIENDESQEQVVPSPTSRYGEGNRNLRRNLEEHRRRESSMATTMSNERSSLENGQPIEIEQS